jgi:hypothetical protein
MAAPFEFSEVQANYISTQLRPPHPARGPEVARRLVSLEATIKELESILAGHQLSR